MREQWNAIETDDGKKLRPSASQLIRAAIVGTGYIADFHARAIRSMRGVELVSVCDANVKIAQAFADTWGVPTAFHSVEHMLRAQNIHALHVLTPPDTHHSLAKIALGFGSHVFLEKPMCISLEEADELIALADRVRLYLAVNHNFLHSDAYISLRNVIHSGKVGPLDHVTLNYFFELEQFGPDLSTPGCSVNRVTSSSKRPPTLFQRYWILLVHPARSQPSRIARSICLAGVIYIAAGE